MAKVYSIKTVFGEDESNSVIRIDYTELRREAGRIMRMWWQ